MKEMYPLSKEEEKKIFWQSFKTASIASWGAGGTLFGGILVGFIFLKQLNCSWLESILTGLLVYISYLSYYFPKTYSLNYTKVFEKFYESEYEKIRHYGKSYEYLGAAFAIIHKMNRVKDLTFEMAVSELSNFCTLINSFFEFKNGAPCACCIKILIKSKSHQRGDYQVITLCRDSKSSALREPAKVTRTHTVKGNTCFLHFFENIDTHERHFFLSNDLTKHADYHNSSFEYYGKPTNEQWTLPYKSEIVVPLVAKLPDDNTPALGFFCVDSQGVGNFHSEFDPEMLIGVADGLYNTLHHQVKEKYGIASGE